MRLFNVSALSDYLPRHYLFPNAFQNSASLLYVSTVLSSLPGFWRGACEHLITTLRTSEAAVRGLLFARLLAFLHHLDKVPFLVADAPGGCGDLACIGDAFPEFGEYLIAPHRLESRLDLAANLGAAWRKLINKVGERLVGCIV